MLRDALMALTWLCAASWLVPLTAAAPKKDLYGDPLPKGATGRLGTTRLRHTGGVISVDWSPNGKWLASSGRDLAVRLWDAKSGKPFALLTAPSKSLSFDLHFFPNSKQLLCRLGNGSIRIWSIPDRKIVREIKTGPGYRHKVTLAPNGKAMAMHTGKEIVLWNAETGAEIRRWEWPRSVPGSGRNTIAFSRNGKQLAAARGKALVFWEVPGGRMMHAIPKASRREITDLLFLPDHKTIISAGYYYESRKAPKGERYLHGMAEATSWEVATGNRIRDWKLKELDLGYPRFALDPKGKQLVIGGSRRMVSLSVATGKVVRSFSFPFPLYYGLSGISFSPDGRGIAFSRGEAAISSWDLHTGKPFFNFPHAHRRGAQSIFFTPNGKKLLTASRDGWIRFWDRNGKETKALRLLPGEALSLLDAQLARDGKTILGLGEWYKDLEFQGVVGLWNHKKIKPFLVRKVGGRVVKGAFSPDGRSLAIAVSGPEEKDKDCQRLEHP